MTIKKDPCWIAMPTGWHYGTHVFKTWAPCTKFKVEPPDKVDYSFSFAIDLRDDYDGRVYPYQTPYSIVCETRAVGELVDKTNWSDSTAYLQMRYYLPGSTTTHTSDACFRILGPRTKTYHPPKSWGIPKSWCIKNNKEVSMQRSISVNGNLVNHSASYYTMFPFGSSCPVLVKQIYFRLGIPAQNGPETDVIWKNSGLFFYVTPTGRLLSDTGLMARDLSLFRRALAFVNRVEVVLTLEGKLNQLNVKSGQLIAARVEVTSKRSRRNLDGRIEKVQDKIKETTSKLEKNRSKVEKLLKKAPGSTHNSRVAGPSRPVRLLTS